MQSWLFTETYRHIGNNRHILLQTYFALNSKVVIISYECETDATVVIPKCIAHSL